MTNSNSTFRPVVVSDLSFTYGEKPIVKGISFEVPFGHTTLLVGDNGAGKSTIIKLILGELTADSGKVKLFGQNPKAFSDWEKVGYVPQFQSQGMQGFPATALELVHSGLMNKSVFAFLNRKQVKVDKQACLEALAMCGIENLSSKLISSLSGGQRQRVMLARALVKKPELLVLDEPTASLDIHASKQFFVLLEQLCHENNLAALVVTHDQAQSECRCSKVVRLVKSESGSIKEDE